MADDTRFRYLTAWADLHQALWVDPSHMEHPHLDRAELRYEEAVALLEQRDRLLEDWLNTQIGFPQAWCKDGAATTVPDGGYDTVTVVTLDPISSSAALLAVDVTVRYTFTVAGDYALAAYLNGDAGGYFGLGEFSEAVALTGWGSRLVSQHYCCLVAAAGVTAPFLTIEASGADPVGISASVRLIEVAAGSDPCCAFSTPA